MSGFDLSNFLASFFDEARERLSSINQALVKFEAGDLTEEGMVALRRDAHTIKGSALMLGVTDIGEAAHIFEDMMEQLMKHPSWRKEPAMIQFLYDIHDALDDRLKDPDAQQLIEAGPLQASQQKLIDHIDKPMAAPISTPDNLVPLPTISKPTEEETPLLIDSLDRENQDDDITTIDIDMIEDFPDLDGWLSGDEISFESIEEVPVLDLDDRTSNTDLIGTSDSKPIVNLSEKVPTTELIGAGEAEAWKKQQQANLATEAARVSTLDCTSVSQTVSEIEPRKHETAVDIANIEVLAGTEVRPTFTEAPRQIALKEAKLDSDASSFRPNIEQMEMNKTAQRKSSGRFLRVDAERLENLSNQVIELSTQQARDEAFETQFIRLSKDFRTLQRDFQHFEKSADELDAKASKQLLQQLNIGFEQQARQQRRFIEDVRFSNIRNEYMMRDLRDQVLALMLRPLDNIFSTFPRAIRDVAIRLNKRVSLVIGGKTLEMDQGVTESLVEPLVHLLNNAVAHGIESPKERLAAGKPEEGQVSIIAQQNGSEIRIEIMDDGRGLDTEIIKKSAVSKGVTTQVEADQMDSAEILEMIFRPGFTTRETVDATSGRGIGMNVVQDTVRRLTGSIRIQSEVGKGTNFILSIPVSIAVQFALIFRMGDMRFGMLTHMVEQAIPYHTTQVQRSSDGKEFILYEHYQVPLVDMRHVLGNSDATPEKKKGNIIIAEHIEGYVGIVVDELLDDIEIVVRDLDPYIKRYNPQGLMGNTIASDGSVIMLLEPYGIKEMGRTSPDQHIEIHVKEDDKLHFNILLVDDSLIAREVEKSIFESIGFEVDTAIDGLDALEKLQVKTYDMVVTDLEMPRLDGFGLVRRIRNQSRYENLPLMIISTRESVEDRMRALESGADTYMVKQQLKGDEILQTVKSLVGKVPLQ
ncbi:MAG: response regulator [Mariprofundaceae bacterium]|nr:response regulator [Mariprofundaceae bacterium]